VLYLIKKDLKEVLEDKKRITVILAVLIIFIISTSYNVRDQKALPVNLIKFGLSDEDSSPYSKMLIEYFRESESFSSYIQIIEGSSKELEQAFYQGKIDLFLQIPKDFAENIMYLDHLPVKVLISNKDVTKAVLLKNILDGYEKYIRAVEVNCVALFDTMKNAGMDNALIRKKNVEISYNLIFTALGKEKFFQYQKTSDYPVTSLFHYYIFAILSIFLSYIGLYVGFLLMKEKKAGILKRLYSVGTSIFTILMEKVLFSACFVFGGISLVYGFTAIYQEHKISLAFEGVLISACLFSICFSIFLSGLFYRIQSYMIAGNFVCFLWAVIGGSIIPIMYLPKAFTALSVLTPNYWLVRTLLSVQKGTGEGLVLKFLLSMAAGVIICLFLSVKLYGREEVYYEE
jgi:ABC-2 type transport system permease protein